MSTYDAKAPREIRSPANPRVKWLVSLRRRRIRDGEGVTVVEGHDEVRLALAVGAVPRTLYFCPSLIGDRSDLVSEVTALGAEVVALARPAFAKASYREGPDGWLAVVPGPARGLDDLTLSTNPLVLVCEGIEKPGNLGAMLRTAEAAGVDAVIAASPVADWGNPNVVRASKGTVFAVQVASGTSEHVRDWCRGRHLRIVVATPDTDLLVTEVDLTEPTAFVVGAEHDGVSDTWLQAAADTARLPMFGHVNSLNVATSAAIAIYEAIRQRA